MMMLSIGIMSFAQEEETELKLSETERIVDKYGGQIKQEFNNLMESVTPIATDGFEMVIKLQIAKGIGMLLPIVIFIILFILFMNELNKDKNEDLIITFAIGSGIFIIIAIFTTYYGILHLLAPEWFAVKEILELF